MKNIFNNDKVSDQLKIQIELTKAKKSVDEFSAYNAMLQKVKTRKNKHLILKFTASVALLISVLVYFNNKNSVEYFTYSNTTEYSKSFTLPDSSTVILRPNSKFTFHQKESQREFNLQGAAYFKIHKNKNAPATIKTNKIDIHVLGTEFSVKNPAHYDNEIILYEGSIELEIKSNNQSEFVLMKPGEKFSYNSNIITLNSVQINRIDDSYYHFKNVGFKEFINGLEDIYGYRIKADQITNLENMNISFKREDDIKSVLKIMTILYNNITFSINENTKTIDIIKTIK
ncbi:MAG: FecR family protein [Oceanospirillaceae bacterium]|nr:FecR family protein [Oceanospirillaceae bacterium]